MNLQPGDECLVVSVGADGSIELEHIGGGGPPKELVRVQNEHGQVAWMSRDEYEGRRDGTWETFKSHGF